MSERRGDVGWVDGEQGSGVFNRVEPNRKIEKSYCIYGRGVSRTISLIGDANSRQESNNDRKKLGRKSCKKLRLQPLVGLLYDVRC